MTEDAGQQWRGARIVHRRQDAQGVAPDVQEMVASIQHWAHLNLDAAQQAGLLRVLRREVPVMEVERCTHSADMHHRFHDVKVPGCPWCVSRITNVPTRGLL